MHITGVINAITEEEKNNNKIFIENQSIELNKIVNFIMNRCMRPLNRHIAHMNSCINIKIGDIRMNQRAHSANCVNPVDEDPKIIECSKPYAVKVAADRLHCGKVIALPTDTVYGLACSANDQVAIQKLYEIKGRHEEKPVAVCVSSIAQLKYYSEADHLADDLLCRLLPGAVTLILNKSKHLNNPFLNHGIQKIGLRIPDYEFIQSVSAKFLEPIALTSANKSGADSTLDVYEFQNLWPYLDAVFDGGHLGDMENDMKQRCASTVVDLSIPGVYKIIRNGIAFEHTNAAMREFNIKRF